MPALILNDSDQQAITETGAILELIADLAPQADLRPSAPYAAALMRSYLHYLASTMHVNHAHSLRGPGGQTALNPMPTCWQKCQKP